MSAYITNIPEIGSSLDIENVLRELGIDSTERSGQEIRCGCPLHNGEDRNFSINTSTQAWKCHSNPECGGGSGTNKIVILDCWRKNGDYFRDKRDSKEKIKDVATRTRGARVPNTKKNPYNNNCLVEEPISSPPSDVSIDTYHCINEEKPVKNKPNESSHIDPLIGIKNPDRKSKVEFLISKAN